MKIVAFETESWERDAFESLGRDTGHEVVCTEKRLDEETASEFADADVISTFIYSSLDRDVLEKLENLRMISTRSTGFDHIDLDHCRSRGVLVCNVPSYGENTVAEHVFGLLLTISHKIWEAIDRTRKGDFTLKGLRGFDLEGKTLGVIGVGAIGEHVARIARGFGMQVVAYDIDERPEIAKELGFEYASLEETLERSDVVSLHVPLNEKTKGMIGAKEFDRMKDGAVLINTARGAVVDIKALIRALSTGKVSAAGLDVLPDEPAIREEAELLRRVFREEYDLETLLADHVLLRLRNVYITPHSAFDTREGVGRILETTVENIRAFVEGAPKNAVIEPEREPA